MRRGLSLLFSLSLCLTVFSGSLGAAQDSSARPSESRPQYATETPEQLQQLVAPIDLYPDSLIAQILMAATFPEQVVEADRFLQAHPDLKGDALAKEVDQQPWDPSVRALTAFPSVLGNMDKNLSWTSTLGDAYYNQEEDVMAAVQVMRQRAQAAGNLKTTQQQVVKTEGETIIVEPAEAEVVYVPAYDPWVVYGDPVVVAWPGWYAYPGIWYAGPYVWWGVGFEIGWSWGYGWGWHHWGCDWHHHWVEHDHYRYYSRSRTYYNRSSYYRDGRGGTRDSYGNRTSNRGSGEHGNEYNHSGTGNNRSEGDARAARGYGDSRGQSNTHTGAFSNYNHGGEERGYSGRGRSSYGGGGSSHEGGAGPHGGGFGGGGFHGGGGGHR